MKFCQLLLVTSVVLSSCNKTHESQEAPPGSVAPAAVASVPDPAKPESPLVLPTPIVPAAVLSTPLVPAAMLPDMRPQAAIVDSSHFDCNALDYGLYWFGLGDMAQKFSPETHNSFYDPSKPTMIFVHGWQSGSHLKKTRTTFNYSKADPLFGPKVDEADAWIAAGWNVGMFYWNQFADDLSVNKMEDRVWNDAPITWKNCKGQEMSAAVPPGNASDLFYNTYIAALKDYTGPNIRLVGHSLGNQLVVRMAARASEAAKSGKIDSHLLPKRVALLDPFWAAPVGKAVSRATLIRALVASLKSEGMILEWYKTSMLPEAKGADANAEMLPMIGATELSPDYYSVNNPIFRHGAAIYLYFLSFANPPPPGCRTPCSEVAPSAATPDDRMLELMNRAAQWKQVSGTKTPDTADNTFELKK